MADDNAPPTRGDSRSKAPLRERLSNWEAPLSGHGTAYFHELKVEFRTLEWVNPYSAAVGAARAAVEAAGRQAHELADSARQAANRQDRALQQAVGDAEAAAVDARARLSAVTRLEVAAERGAARARLMILELLQAHQKGASRWRDVLEFESALLRLLPKEKLVAKYASLAKEYRGVTGQPAPDPPADALALRAQAETLMTDLHWAYTTIPVQERIKNNMLLGLGCVTAALALGLLLLVKYCPCPTLPWVALVGATGAALSAFQRIQSRGFTGDALTSCDKDYDLEPPEAKPSGGAWARFTARAGYAARHVWKCITVTPSFSATPLLGAAFALVLAHFLSAGVVSGPLFPDSALSRASTATNGVVRTNQVGHPAGTTTSQAGQTNPAGPSTAPTDSRATPPTNGRVESPSGLPTNPPASLLQSPVRPAAPGESAPAAERSAESAPSNPPSPTPDPADGPDGTATDCWAALSCRQLALLLVWAFIAGFSERLVPDLISRFSERARAPTQ